MRCWLLALYLTCAGVLAILPQRGHAQSDGESETEARRFFQEASNALQAGRVREAIGLFEQSLALSRRSSTALNLAHAMREASRRREALELYQDVLARRYGEPPISDAELQTFIRGLEREIEASSRGTPELPAEPPPPQPPPPQPPPTQPPPAQPPPAVAPLNGEHHGASLAPPLEGDMRPAQSGANGTGAAWRFHGGMSLLALGGAALATSLALRIHLDSEFDSLRATCGVGPCAESGLAQRARDADTLGTAQSVTLGIGIGATSAGAGLLLWYLFE